MGASSVKRGKKTWYLYIVVCCDETLYTGITNDLPGRLNRHNAGTASRYTRSRLPVRLLYKKRCINRSSALKQEYALKQLSRTEKMALIRKNAVRRQQTSISRKFIRSRA